MIARLDLAGDEAVQDAALRFDRLELVPCRFASASVSASTLPEPAAGSATKSIWLSLGQDQLRVARDAAGERVGQAVRDACAAGSRSVSAPPAAAAKAAIVVRRMLVSGSIAVIMR